MRIFGRSRTVACATSIALASILMSGASSAYAQQDPVELKVSLFTPPTGVLNIQMKSVVERLEKESDGRIAVQVFESSQMGPAPRQFDLVAEGVADVSIMLMTISPGRFPLMELGSLPNVVSADSPGEASMRLSSAFLKVSEQYLAGEFEGAKLMNVAISPGPVVMSTKDVKSLSDLADLRIRHLGELSALTLEALGMVPVNVSPTDMAESLARGVIDGTVTIYTGVTAFQLQDITKYSLEIPSGGVVFGIFMNEDTYEDLPDDLKPIVDKYFGPAIQDEWSELFAREEAAAKKMLGEQMGIATRVLPDEDQARAEELAIELRDRIIAEREASGIPAADFIAAVQAAAESE